MIITSLTWFDLSVLAAIVGISLKVGRILQTLDNVIEDAKGLKRYGVRLTILETKYAELEKKLASGLGEGKWKKKK